MKNRDSGRDLDDLRGGSGGGQKAGRWLEGVDQGGLRVSNRDILAKVEILEKSRKKRKESYQEGKES